MIAKIYNSSSVVQNALRNVVYLLILCMFMHVLPVHAIEFSKLPITIFDTGEKKLVFLNVVFQNGAYHASANRNVSLRAGNPSPLGFIPSNLSLDTTILYGFIPITYTSKTGEDWIKVKNVKPTPKIQMPVAIKNQTEFSMRELGCAACANYTVGDIAFGKGKRIVAVGGISLQGVVMFSLGGKTFFPVMGNTKGVEYIADNDKLTCFPARVIYGNGAFVFKCSKGTRSFYYYSADGKVWHKSHLSTKGSLKLKFVNGNFMGFGEKLGVLITSLDGDKWQSHRMKIKGVIKDIAYGNGAYILITNGSQLYTARVP